MTPEWKKHIEATRFLRSRPNRQGEVAVYQRTREGGLRFERMEKARPQSSAISSR